MKKTKRFSTDGYVTSEDSNSGMKEARDAYDYDRAMGMAEVDSKSDYSPKPEITVHNEKTGSTGGSQPAASKPAPKPTPKPAPRPAPAPAKTQKPEPAKEREAAAEMRRESNRGAEKSTSKAEESSKSSGTYKGFDGKIHNKSESSRPDIGGAIGRGISGFFSSIRERGKKSNPDAYAKGGSVSSASSRGDGIAQRGKTRGKMC
jgi:hypothetical protein